MAHNQPHSKQRAAVRARHALHAMHVAPLATSLGTTHRVAWGFFVCLLGYLYVCLLVRTSTLWLVPSLFCNHPRRGVRIMQVAAAAPCGDAHLSALLREHARSTSMKYGPDDTAPSRFKNGESSAWVTDIR